jgi:hypothetical protein
MTPKGGQSKGTNPATPAATPGTIGRYNVTPSTVKGVEKSGGKLKSLMPFIIEIMRIVLDKKKMPEEADMDAILSSVVKKMVHTFPGQSLLPEQGAPFGVHIFGINRD